MSSATGVVSRGDEGQITYANATMQVMAGRGILRYELPLAKNHNVSFTGEVRANELRLNWLTHAPWVKTARIGLRGTWCELCAYLNSTGRAWHVARLSYLRLATAGGY